MNETFCPIAVIDKCINKKMKFSEISKVMNIMTPHKNYTKTDIELRKTVLKKNVKQLLHLKTLPVIEQKSEEWYNVRKNLITASDFAQALGEGKFGTQKQFYEKKCGFDEDVFNANLPPLKWGNMFESVAQSIYSRRNEVIVHEFGLIKHPSISHFGASPDGITENGIMLEIKCPYKRKINGEIPQQYVYQIQGQLEVCNLDECDYFECEFDKSAMFIESELEKGAIIEQPGNNYIYSETKQDWDVESISQWIQDNNSDVEKNIVHYYALRKCNTLRVFKDKEFVDSKLELLDSIWAKILEYRDDEKLYRAEVAKTKSYSRKVLGGKDEFIL